jgi:hypothetical protein
MLQISLLRARLHTAEAVGPHRECHSAYGIPVPLTLEAVELRELYDELVNSSPGNREQRTEVATVVRSGALQRHIQSSQAETDCGQPAVKRNQIHDGGRD